MLLSPSAALPAVTVVAGGFANIDVRLSIGAGLVEETTDFVSDLRRLIQPHAPADHPDSSVYTPVKSNSKEKAASSSKSPRDRKRSALIFFKVNLKLPLLAAVSKKASSSRSNSFFLAVSAGSRNARRAILSGVHSGAVDDDVMLLFIS